jgi:hypothetical protein
VKKEKETSNILINIKQRQLKESEAIKEKILKNPRVSAGLYIVR